MNTIKMIDYLILLLVFFPCKIFAQFYNIHDLNFNHVPTSLFNSYQIMVPANNANDDIIKMDSIITNSVTGSSIKLLFQYNNTGNISEYLVQTNDGLGWNNLDKHILSYNNNNLLTDIILDWNTNKWDSTSRNIYFYVQNKIYQSILQEYNSNTWNNYGRYTFEYDTNGNEISNIYELWNNNTWEYNTMNVYFYSKLNLRDSIIYMIWNNNEWQNDKKTIFYYNQNEIDLDSLVAKNWDGNKWINIIKQKIVNNSNHNQIQQIFQTWVINIWQNSEEYNYTYNEFNYVESINCKLWNNNQWVNGDGIIFFENPDGFIAGFVSNNLSAYYTKIVGVDDIKNSSLNSYLLSQNYPNPFNPSTKIKYEIPISNYVTLKVYDLLGREVKTLVNGYQNKGVHEVIFNGNNLSSGVYIYHFIAGTYSECRKMILQK